MVDSVLLRQMEQTQAYFEEKVGVFEKVEKLCEQLKMLDKHVKSSSLWNIAKWLGFIVYVWKLLPPIFSWYAKSDFTIYMENANFLTLMLNPPLFLVGFVLLYALPATFLGSWLASVRRRSSIPFRQSCEQGLAELEKEFTTHYDEFEARNGFACPVPFERTHPKLVAQLIDIMRAGRADTVKESINVEVQDAHNARVEALQLENNKQLKTIQNRTSTIETYALFNLWLSSRNKP